ncbi:hypothetical protein [Chitinophaga qingshengii]|uniref:Heparinase II C-terminal domain-containing protein n=1 Tax=Chitinophaga qingshengii TaxID=1569794 RepID=A0ABR7TXF0_9BACT|nr:hypothetical protein [Chitinophaga qingshengii]MBC9934713.1 hypothetical protein [Chitinophaga qingshengii]
MINNSRRLVGVLLWSLGWYTASAQLQQWNVDKAGVNRQTTELVKGPGKITWAALKKDRMSSVDSSQTPPDLVFQITLPRSGTYEMITYAVTEQNIDSLVQQGKVETSRLKIQFTGQRPTQRIVFDSWNHSSQIAGKFDFSSPRQQVKIWLPKGIRLQYIAFKPYTPPTVPAAAQLYKPAIVPRPGRPRLWLNEESFPVIKARLLTGENKAAWDKVKTTALQPFPFVFDPEKEVFYNTALEQAAENKAFYYLMTGDTTIGRQAVELITRYLTMLEFGNVKYGDITREVGRAIYTGALVYDWCYPLLDASTKQTLRYHMMRQAREMEIGWPPFDNSAINGHGNEAQVNRDLLAMSIAIYDEDPLPYQYASYIILEQLVPMRKFEYASPRHDQGVDYGAYRFGWEMHAAWLFYRMTGRPVFDDNIKNLPYWWLYMRLPDGTMLHDGDMFSVRAHRKTSYWKQPQTMLLCYAYANDPILKAEFEREGGLPDNPVLFLLVNDPALKPDTSLASLPLSKDYGNVIGAMVARTGWNNQPGSNDVVAQIKGGGYHFGNHQHADAGALEIYYHGLQLGHVGLYLSYGTPYDFNFNKRSVSHSMMLARDPSEPLLFRTEANDGGSRFSQRFPVTPAETTTDPWFNYGTVISASYNPVTAERPGYSYFKADLTAAYAAKMHQYTRGFCFLNLGREDVPAAIILTDDMTTTQASFKKYWQITTLQQPEQTPAGFVLHNTVNGITGKTQVNMLLPKPENRETVILSGDSATSTFGFSYKVNSPAVYRIMVSPKTAQQQDRYLTVFQMIRENAAPLPVSFYETTQSYVITIGNRIVVMAPGTNAIDSTFSVAVPADQSYEIVLAGLAPGFWNITDNEGKVVQHMNIAPGKNTWSFYPKTGTYRVAPGRPYKDIRK